MKVDELAHKVMAVDSFNMLYQFLTTIRMRDGTPLKNSKGQVTSHLVGLFSRVTNLMEQQLKLVFVYDGETPALKKAERARRKEAKQEAARKHEEAVKAEDVEGMRKYAGRTAVLTADMIEESRRLLEALGIPWIQAPAEGEAQAAHLVKSRDADYVVSQDTDCLLFGAPKMIKNLSISGKRRKPGSNVYINVYPEVISLEDELKRLGISQKQLIALGMLVGTDFNPGGIKGLGPKKGLKLVKEHGENLERVFSEAGWDEHQQVSWQEVYELISTMQVTDDYKITWRPPNPGAAKKLLVEEFAFSDERVSNALNKLGTSQAQKGLGDYF